jgi:TonB family protein
MDSSGSLPNGCYSLNYVVAIIYEIVCLWPGFCLYSGRAKEAFMNRRVLGFVGALWLLMGMTPQTFAWLLPSDEPAPGQNQTDNPNNAVPKRQPIKTGAMPLHSNLIEKVDPVYPEAAKRERISEKVTVTLRVTVDEQGKVSNIQVISGHKLFNDAVISAVKKWTYRPVLLNGAPVPVSSTVTISFAPGAQTGSVVLDPPPGK